ncbi:fimbrial biogenesis outer membrane usher protein [Halovulum dunhuangense]|uniref:Fimbrial biogenesis outer membrane usher protein n=1 Tax=Halovulum dunhuangense TaxID=1505036 RepID=A0A849L706_9RHOB|nr:fimbria/pilus outer membrane usher protein [Halovulum dunhuangense]NNU82033.1 fimbrial biogenesis outer membrane usher protein [Halovulum dunhuangense]
MDRFRGRTRIVGVLTFLLMSTAALRPAGAEPAAVPAIAQAGGPFAGPFLPSVDMPLFLLVLVNGEDTGLIAEFTQHAGDGRISSTAGELRQVGIKASGGDGRTVHLDDIPGLSYVYDDISQTIEITAPHSQLVPRQISAVKRPAFVPAQPGLGAVLNYGLTGNLGSNLLDDGFELSSLGAYLDGRIYTPFGVLSSTGTASFPDWSLKGGRFQRQETVFSYSNPQRMITFSAGDIQSSGPQWSRPVRMGGLQLMRDFSLRSDVVNTPLLTYSGAAALPSTVDVFIDNVRAWSGQIEPGPFVLTELPTITSQGEARIVVRDSEGNEQVARVPFFAARDLLRRGKLDFSLEVGHAREAYGERNFQYGDATIYSASARYGVSDHFTLEGHVEGSNDLFMGGIGFTTTPFHLAELTLAAGASRYGSETGHFVHGRLRTEVLGARINLETFRSFGDFRDLAYATGVDYLGADVVNEDVTGLIPARAQDSLSVYFPEIWDGAGLSLGLVNAERGSDRRTILSATYSQRFEWTDASLRAAAFKSVRGDGGYGVSIGLSIPLGRKTHASTSVSRSENGGTRAIASLSRPMRREAGSLGYRLDLNSQDGELTGNGRVEYRSRYGQAGLSLRETGQGVGGSVTLSGALVAAGGGIFVGNRISDAFAVVDVGVPGVEVMLHNQPVTRTGPLGRALVPDLRAYRVNRVSIDPASLPIDASIDATSFEVVPARKSGAALKFGSGSVPSALVVLRDPTGAFLSVGSIVRLEGGDDEFIVGFDGETWIEGLGATNRIVVTTPQGPCTAEFAFAPRVGEQVVIEDVECR